MKYLSYFSPAETLIVLQDTKADYPELLKLTFMDLLVKQVLRTFDVEKQVPETGRILEYKYVEVGPNFVSYIPSDHEMVFIDPFNKNKEIQILFRNMMKIGYRNSRTPNKYILNIISNSNLQHFFKRSIIERITGKFSLSEAGVELRHQIKQEIEGMEIKVTELLTYNPDKAATILEEIKGNIFLLNIPEFELLNLFDKTLIKEMQNSTNSNSGCSGGTWISFENYSTIFDNSCGGESGCGSGCSGCGGGGCGGGGGD